MVKLSCSLFSILSGLSVLVLLTFNCTSGHPFIDQRSLDILFRPDNNTIKAFQGWLRGPLFGLFNGGGPFEKYTRFNTLNTAIINNNASASDIPNRPGLLSSLGFAGLLGIGGQATAPVATTSRPTTTTTAGTTAGTTTTTTTTTSTTTSATTTKVTEIGLKGSFSDQDDDNDNDDKKDTLLNGNIDSDVPNGSIMDKSISIKSTFSSTFDDDDDDEDLIQKIKQTEKIDPRAIVSESKDKNMEIVKLGTSIKIGEGENSDDKIVVSSISSESVNDNNSKLPPITLLKVNDEDNEETSASEDNAKKIAERVGEDNDDDDDDHNENDKTKNNSNNPDSSIISTVFNVQKQAENPDNDNDTDDDDEEVFSISSDLKEALAADNKGSSGGSDNKMETITTGGYKYEKGSSGNDNKIATETISGGYQYNKATTGTESLIHESKPLTSLKGGYQYNKSGSTEFSLRANLPSNTEGDTDDGNAETNVDGKLLISLSGRGFGTKSDDDNDDDDDNNEVVDDSSKPSDNNDRDNDEENDLEKRRRNIRRNGQPPSALPLIAINPEEVNNLRFIRRFVSRS